MLQQLVAVLALTASFARAQLPAGVIPVFLQLPACGVSPPPLFISQLN